MAQFIDKFKREGLLENIETVEGGAWLEEVGLWEYVMVIPSCCCSLRWTTWLYTPWPQGELKPGGNGFFVVRWWLEMEPEKCNNPTNRPSRQFPEFYIHCKWPACFISPQHRWACEQSLTLILLLTSSRWAQLFPFVLGI